MKQPEDKILIIKLSALGDFIQALGPIQAIRQHHPQADITLLTTPPFQKFAQDCGYVNHIWLDDKPGWLTPHKWLAFRKKLNKAGFTRIYDLQNNDRSNAYFKLLRSPKPEWIGTAKGASHQNTSPDRTKGHAFDGHVQTLALAGLTNIKIDRLNWMQADISAFNLPERYALLVPGCAPQHPYKRWPADKFAAIANHLDKTGITPVLIGTKDDADATAIIAAQCAKAINLTGQTNLQQIAVLARHATIAIGNDTGPMHLIAATGCPCLSLFSGRTNPIKHAPKGDNVTVLQENNLENMDVKKVLEQIQALQTTAQQKQA